MGNSKSKVAKAELNEKLDLAEKNHASAVKTIVVREEELERCKREAATATSENETLKQKADSLETKYEALQLCIWYIEMTLLCILDFDDIYFNRCSKEIYASKAEELVPWTKKKIA